MKKMTFKVCMAACCAALALSACSEEDATLHGVAPSKIGTISLNTGKDQVRPGQPLTAYIALPTGGQNISEATYTWGVLNYPSDKEENGTAYFSFTAPEEPGQYNLSFNARYLFLGPDAEGNIYKDMSSTLDYTVITCNIFSSFWNDDITTTLKVYHHPEGIPPTHGKRIATRHLFGHIRGQTVLQFCRHYQPRLHIQQRRSVENHGI